MATDTHKVGKQLDFEDEHNLEIKTLDDKLPPAAGKGQQGGHVCPVGADLCPAPHHPDRDVGYPTDYEPRRNKEGTRKGDTDGWVRLIEIERCCDCPHISKCVWQCGKTRRELEHFGDPIPEWCPLPKAPNEKAKSQGEDNGRSIQ